jgi:hypothetical protein
MKILNRVLPPAALLVGTLATIVWITILGYGLVIAVEWML